MPSQRIQWQVISPGASTDWSSSRPARYAEHHHHHHGGAGTGQLLTVIVTIIGLITGGLTLAAELLKARSLALHQDRCRDAATHWDSAEQDNTIAAYQEHIRQFPTCKFVGMAQLRIANLKESARRGLSSKSPSLPRGQTPAVPAIPAVPAVPPAPAPAPPRLAPAIPKAPPPEIRTGIGWLGVQLNSGATGGALVTFVHPGSPAGAAGIRPGDWIIALNGLPLSRGGDLSSRIAYMKPRTTISLCVVRSGSSFGIQLQLSRRPTDLDRKDEEFENYSANDSESDDEDDDSETDPD